MDLELGATTSRVRSSLDSKVYANENQVVIAIADIGSYDFKENTRELHLFLDVTGLGKIKKCREGWLDFPTSLEIRS